MNRLRFDAGTTMPLSSGRQVGNHWSAAGDGTDCVTGRYRHWQVSSPVGAVTGSYRHW